MPSRNRVRTRSSGTSHSASGVQPPQVVEEAVDVDAAQVAVGELRDEVRLVGDSELRVSVEHDAEQRRAGTPHAEDEDRRSAGGQRLRS
jgi:hypothetical protein